MYRTSTVCLLLALPAHAAGVELVYDVELFSNDTPSRATMTMTADGARLRVELSDAPFFFVADGDRKEVATFIPAKEQCFRIKESDFTRLQAAALRKHLAEVRKDARLSAAEKDELIGRAQKALDELGHARTRAVTLSFKQHTKVGEYGCELYAMSEDGEDRGQTCLQLTGKPPATLQLTLGNGEWWQSIQTLRAGGRTPVLFERKQAGAVTHRATLRSRTEKKIAPETFHIRDVCKSADDLLTQ
jgi:hypothetical protein